MPLKVYVSIDLSPELNSVLEGMDNVPLDLNDAANVKDLVAEIKQSYEFYSMECTVYKFSEGQLKLANKYSALQHGKKYVVKCSKFNILFF